VAQTEYFCTKSLKPWLIAIAILTVWFVIWVFLDREELLPRREIETTRQAVQVRKGEPVIPSGPARVAAFASPLPEVVANPYPNPDPVNNPYPANPYNLAAVTKATPYGGVQVVANPSVGGFQDALKKSVNAVMPTVCDIHAIWMQRPTARPRFANAPQTPKFVPPFDGTIDKFIQNRGYENVGAGVIVDQRGLVLTNCHVVQDATNIVVTVPGNPSVDYTATLVGSDPNKDLALLQLNTKDTFQEARLGDSSFVQVGDYVISIGSPFGMEQTVTSGIISGNRKSILIDGIEFKNLLQTDAPINRGSSGGPLVNLSGEVIGITTAIYAPTGVFNGTGFVIPINDAKEFLAATIGVTYPVALDRRGMFSQSIPANTNLAAGNRPAPVRFGVEAIDLDPLIAKKMGAAGGVLVNGVLENSPASIAGIFRGDVLLSIAGVPMTNIQDVAGAVSHFKSGDSVNVRIVRNGKINELLVRIW